LLGDKTHADINVGAPQNGAPGRSNPIFERFFLSIRNFRGSSLLQTHAERVERPTLVGHEPFALTIAMRSDENT